MKLITSPKSSAELRPIANARDVRRIGSDLRVALIECGHTHLSFGVALGVSQPRVTQLLQQRALSDELLERIRTTPDTHDVWRWLQWLRQERAAG